MNADKLDNGVDDRAAATLLRTATTPLITTVGDNCKSVKYSKIVNNIFNNDNDDDDVDDFDFFE